MKLTKHAQQRSQQRGIPPMVLDLLTRWGVEERVGGGASRFTMNKETRRILRAYAGSRLFAAIEPYLDCYTILNEDERSVITLAHRYKRLKH